MSSTYECDWADQIRMTKMTNDFGPLFKGRAAYHQRSVPKQLLAGGKVSMPALRYSNFDCADWRRMP